MLALTTAGSVASRVMADAMSFYRGNFPRTVRVETTNHCQADCSFCPRSTIGRAKGFMKQELFEKVVRECAIGGCQLMHLHGFGEPLLDKQLPERIQLCKQSGIGRVKIFTNGDLLRGDLARRLLESGVDEIKVSIDGADAKEFNVLRVGLDHGKVLENVQAFRKLRDDAGLGTPTLVAATCQTSNRGRTEKMLAGVVDRIDFTNIHNWGGALGQLTGKRIRKPCDRLWRTFTVLVSGQVALCCLDHSGKEILGDVNHQRITEIWNNQRYRQLRQWHRSSQQDQIPLCSKCTKCFF
ncbi:MAG: SPASM domain-containing protein [Pirellulales bacterium]|nr:SPASM domain-containing protein [Pirellulales bacterium]